MKTVLVKRGEDPNVHQAEREKFGDPKNRRHRSQGGKQNFQSVASDEAVKSHHTDQQDAPTAWTIIQHPT